MPTALLCVVLLPWCFSQYLAGSPGIGLMGPLFGQGHQNIDSGSVLSHF